MTDVADQTTEAIDEAGFEKFLRRVDEICVARYGLGREDFADCRWRDLFDDVGLGVKVDHVVDELVENDDVVAAMEAVNEGSDEEDVGLL